MGELNQYSETGGPLDGGVWLKSIELIRPGIKSVRVGSRD